MAETFQDRMRGLTAYDTDAAAALSALSLTCQQWQAMDYAAKSFTVDRLPHPALISDYGSSATGITNIDWRSYKIRIIAALDACTPAASTYTPPPGTPEPWIKGIPNVVTGGVAVLVVGVSAFALMRFSKRNNPRSNPRRSRRRRR